MASSPNAFPVAGPNEVGHLLETTLGMVCPFLQLPSPKLASPRFSVLANVSRIMIVCQFLRAAAVDARGT